VSICFVKYTFREYTFCEYTFCKYIVFTTWRRKGSPDLKDLATSGLQNYMRDAVVRCKRGGAVKLMLTDFFPPWLKRY
jgi:hypothetical protein